MRTHIARKCSLAFATRLQSVETVVLAVFVALGVAASAPAAIIRVNAATDVDIQQAINALPASGGTIEVSADAPVAVSQSIVIARDNVTIDFGGATLKLKDGANAPVVIMGESVAVPTTTHTNIQIRNVVIDGNRGKQNSETNPGNPALRNNGISMRKVFKSQVENAIIYSCRSGGLVTELGCQRLVIQNIDSYSNHFDGMAVYMTQDSIFKGLKLHDNGAAGFSADIVFNRNVVSDCVVSGNPHCGIFMRNSRDNVFESLEIRNNGEHGIFLAQVDQDITKPAAGNTFLGCVISNSTGAGIRVNDVSCVNNMLSSSQLIGNTGGGISEPFEGLLQVFAVIVR